MRDTTERLIALCRGGLPLELARAAVARETCGGSSLDREFVAKLLARHLADGDDETRALEGALRLAHFEQGLTADLADRLELSGVPVPVALSLARSRAWQVLQVPRYAPDDLADDDSPDPAPLASAGPPCVPVRFPLARRRHRRCGPQT